MVNFKDVKAVGKLLALRKRALEESYNKRYPIRETSKQHASQLIEKEKA